MMELLKITALDAFVHGRVTMVRGDTHNIEASEAFELEKVGLVSTSPADADSLDDLVGAKVMQAVSNKMESKAPNKTASKTNTQ